MTIKNASELNSKNKTTLSDSDYEKARLILTKSASLKKLFKFESIDFIEKLIKQLNNEIATKKIEEKNLINAVKALNTANVPIPKELKGIEKMIKKGVES